MADYGIKPDIALGVKPAPQQSLSDLLGTATKAMEFSRLSELYPELIKKSQAEAKAAETGAAKSDLELRLSKATALTSQNGALIAHPLVVQAKQNPDKVDKQALVKLLTDNGQAMSQIAGVDWETEGKKLLQPYVTMAMNEPAKLQDYIKQRVVAGLNSQQQLVAAYGEPKEIGGQVVIQRPYTERPIENLPPAGQPPAAQMPAGQPPVGQPPMGQPPVARPPVGVTSADMTRQTNYGVPLQFPKRAPGVQQMNVPPEEVAARTEGEKYLQDRSTQRSASPASLRNVDNVLKTVGEIEKTISFESGKAADIERAMRRALGDENYILLNKEIANLQIAINQAKGADTDQQTQQVARGTGDETYPPNVLKKIASQLRGEVYGIKLEADGAEKFASKFGSANLRQYRQDWDNNADTRVFEAMSILESPALSKEQKNNMVRKLIPDNNEQLKVFQKKYEAINSLSKNGVLPRKENTR